MTIIELKFHQLLKQNLRWCIILSSGLFAKEEIFPVTRQNSFLLEILGVESKG